MLQCSRPGAGLAGQDANGLKGPAVWGLISMIGNWVIGNLFDDVSWFNTLDALKEVGGLVVSNE